MTDSQKAKVWTAVVDALVSTITVIITILVKDESLRALILPLLGSYQVVAVTLIVAVTSTENTAIRANSESLVATEYRRGMEIRASMEKQ